MGRVIRYGNYGVYVNDERGERHHRAHAHVLERRTRVATIFLETLEVLFGADAIPKGLWKEIRERHEDLLKEWERLNGE